MRTDQELYRDSLRRRVMILGKIDRFLRATGMPPTKFGRLAVNDPRLVHDLRCGREPGQRLVARVEAFIRRERGQ